jgi:NADH-quinone oxidoreductase subunit C
MASTGPMKLKDIQERISAFGESVSDVRLLRKNVLHLELDREAILPFAKLIHDELGYDHCSSILGQDDIEHLKLVYHFSSISGKTMLEVYVKVPLNDPVVDSITPIWAGSNFLECEVYDMIGIEFRGHPELRRILTPPDFKGYPHRKDFPLGGYWDE